MDKKETAQILAIIRSVYPNTKIEDAAAMVEGWHLVLGDYSAKTIMNAARLHMATNKYFPTPAEIAEKITRAELLYGNQEWRIQVNTPKQLPLPDDGDTGCDDILKLIDS